MLISNTVSDSFIDYRGEQALVVFTLGCNLDCDVCYNKKVKPQFPEGKDFWEVLDKYFTEMHTALVISGGEPTIQMDFWEVCRDFKKKYPDKKLRVFTNGQNFSQVFRACTFVDSWNIDLKTLQDSTILGIPPEEASLYLPRVLQTYTFLTRNHYHVTINLWRHPKTTHIELHRMIQLVTSVNPKVEYILTDIMR